MMKKVTIKIIKCSVPTYWYNNHINEIFEYVKINKNSYEVWRLN